MHHNAIYYGRIVRNLMRLMDASCQHSLYEVLPRGVQIWIPAEGRGVYPDLTVIAGEPLFDQGYANRVTNPCLLFEVLSEVAVSYDPSLDTMPERSRLFSSCQVIPYLQEYLFIHQQAAKVEQFYRAEEEVWDVTIYEGLAAVVTLNLTETQLPLAEIYQKVIFEDSALNEP